MGTVNSRSFIISSSKVSFFFFISVKMNLCFVRVRMGFWRIRKNHELNELIGNADIVRFIKSRRIAWLGHVTWMDGMRMPRRILEWKPIGRRIRGRPRKRWIEDVEEDIQTMGIRGWRKLSKERMEWKKITEKAKTHSGL